MLNETPPQILRDAAIVIVTLFAIQGAMYYINTPLPLASLILVAVVIISIRSAMIVVRARRGSQTDT